MTLPLHSQQVAETNNPVFKARKLCREAGLFVSTGSVGVKPVLRFHIDRNTKDHSKVIKAFCLINHWMILHETPNIITARIK